MYYAYAIYSESTGKIYVGMSSDPHARLLAHNHPANKGWTKSFRPWILIYIEEFEIKSDALARETELKSFRGREFIRGLIKKN